MQAIRPTSSSSSFERSFAARSRQELALTTSPEAAALYRRAIDAELGAQSGVAELLDQALACDPGFALAHAARWKAIADGDALAARAARDAAMASLPGVTEWERSHVLCIAALIEGDPEAPQICREHLAAHPHDLLVTAQWIGDLFFHGGPGKREAVMAVLRPLAPHNREDWAFLARLGFHTSELGDHEGAIEILEHALTLRPEAPFVAHAMAHALLESGRRADSHRFLVDWYSRHDATGPLDGHIEWHLALGELESGAPREALERYHRSSAPGANHCAAGLLLADAGGLFFRMRLAGTPLDDMPRAQLHQLLLRLRPALKVPFVAVHAAALAVALGDEDAVGYLEAMASSRGSSATDATARVVSAFKAYLGGNWQSCVDALEIDRPTAWEAIGGSNEERALLNSLYASASEGRKEAP